MKNRKVSFEGDEEESLQRSGLQFPVITGWKPLRLTQPRPVDDFDSLGLIERVVQSIIYAILVFEYSISPGGAMRAWLRLNLCAATGGTIVAVTVLPVGTALLNGFSNWSEFIRKISENMLWAVVNGILLVGAILIAGKVFYWWIRQKKL